MDLNIRIGGEAGQGLVSLGETLTGALCNTGLHVFTGKSYMSRIRGGLNWFDVRISGDELFALREQADLIVALSDEARDILKEFRAPGGLLLYNGEGENQDGILNLNFVEMAKETADSKLMANSVAAGAIFALLGYEPAPLFAYLKKIFHEKGEEVVGKNLECARKGYAEANKQSMKLEAPASGNISREYTSGGNAMALAAAVAGVKLVSAYPMTPGTATFAGLAALSDQYGIVVEQAEDEIAAINMICGAAYAGVPAMTATSGGGFALMCEGLSLAGMMELPIVVVLAQRPGPATGLPTRTAQEDLKFAINAGHGEFARVVYSPGTIQQCYDLTRTALATAHEFQTPAIILTDQYLQDIQKNIGELDGEYQPIDRHIVENADKDYQRYLLAPGNIYGKKDAGLVLVCWGSSYGPCREAVDELNARKVKSALLHYSQVWPLDASAVGKLLDILQPCVSFNHTNTFKWFKERVKPLDKAYDPFNREAALKVALSGGDEIPIGIIYRSGRNSFESQVEVLGGGPLIEQYEKK